MDQHKTPLFDALVQHATSNPLPFHIPGHKKGKGMDPAFRSYMGDNALAIDLINIVPLDDLHQPSGIIREAERLAAEAFGSDYTLFSVQGTTGAIMTMIMSVCAPGDKIIVPRNAHKSILSAIIFTGAIPVWVTPEQDRKLGIEHGVLKESIRQAIEQNPGVKAVLLINPTYYGTSVDLTDMVEFVHGYGIPVLVDEAHGTLIHFHEKLPASAMQAGADMAATSVHKLGGSLTQSSILNVKGERVNIKRIRTVMSMLTTTSTSYILLASLDTARRQLAVNGRLLAEKAINLADQARSRINTCPGLYCYGEEILDLKGVYHYDPTKLCVHVGKLGITGYEAELWLREQYNIEVELSDLSNILCLITLGDTEHEVNRLLQALEHMDDMFRRKESASALTPSVIPDAPPFLMPPRDAFYADTETVLFEQSSGRIIAESIYVYPPGIPILMPGQIILQEIVDYITRHAEAGLPIKGPEDSTAKEVKVVVERRKGKETS